MSRARQVVLAVTVALVAAVGVPAAAAAATGAAPAFLRLAHLSPDTPAVDVHLAGVDDPTQQFRVPGVEYGTVSEYRGLPAGTYTVAMREAGAPEDSPPVISTTLTADPDEAYTVAGTGRFADLGLTVLDDELRMPPPDQARVRVINAAASTSRIDIGVVGGPAIAEGVGFAETSGYRTVLTGSWTLEIDTAVADTPAEVPIDVAANAVYTVLLLDGADGFVARLHQDSAGAESVPLGAIETGRSGPPVSWDALALLTAGGVAAVLLGWRSGFRNRRTRTGA